MKVTIYELLGMVKDGKAPKKIKYKNEILYYDDETLNYYDDEDMHSLFSTPQYILTEEVEIIEEKKIPEKICTNRIINTHDILEFEMIQNKINAEYTYTINKIIDYLDYLKSKGE